MQQRPPRSSLRCPDCGGPVVVGEGFARCAICGYTKRAERGRRSDSVRFDPYFKVQVWEARSFAWRDIQKTYPSAEDARDAFPTGERCRVMEITPEKRTPIDFD